MHRHKQFDEHIESCTTTDKYKHMNRWVYVQTDT